MTITTGLKTSQVYTMAAICLVLGLVLGYSFRGSQTRATAAPVQAAAAENTPAPPAAQPPTMAGGHLMPTLDQMRQMADKKAEPLLAQLKSDPNNAGLAIQIAKIYTSTHQFKEAASYYEKSLQIAPKDATARIELASCRYYAGEIDEAVTQLQKVLEQDPKNANSLFNLGMIKWKGKSDAGGAVAEWRQLLRSNPELDEAKKAQVQKLIAEASQPKATE